MVNIKQGLNQITNWLGITKPPVVYNLTTGTAGLTNNPENVTTGTRTQKQVMAGSNPLETVKNTDYSPLKPTSTAQKVADIFKTVPTTEKTVGFTQEDLNALIRLGEDPFKGTNLSKIRDIDTMAAGNRSLQEQAIADLLAQGESDLVTTTDETTQNMFSNTTMGLATQATGIPFTDVKSTNAAIITRAVASLGAAMAATTGMVAAMKSKALVGLVGGIGLSEFKNQIMGTNTDNILSVESTRITGIIDAVKSGWMTPADAMKKLKEIERNIDDIETSLHLGMKKFQVTFTDKGKVLYEKTLSTREDLDLARGELYQLAAAGAIA